MTMKLIHKFPSNKSQGFVMVVVLLFMVILMIVAISAMRTTKDDVAIAGSRYFRNQAFQFTQSSIVLNEKCVTDKIPTACGLANVPDFDGNTAGWLSNNDSNIKARSGSKWWMNPTTWTNTGINRPAKDTTFTGTSSDRLPQYTIEKMELQDLLGASKGSSSELGQVQPYRLTSRVSSPNDGATVVLQRHYWRPPT